MCVGVGDICVWGWCVYREGGMRVCSVVFVCVMCVEVLCAGIGVVCMWGVVWGVVCVCVR